MAQFNLEDYEPVEERIKKFYKDFTDGRILTEVHADDGKAIIFKASVYKGSDDVVWATGFAEEVRGEGFVNKHSAVENCETSAIGRALANANYAGSKRPSREEMEKATREEPKRTNLDAEQVSKLMGIAKLKGLTTKEEAVAWLNMVLNADDFTQLDPAGFEGYKKTISDPKLTVEVATDEIPY